MISDLHLAESNGSKWTFAIIIGDKFAKKGYMINISNALDPAAENRTNITAIVGTNGSFTVPCAYEEKR